MKRKSLILAVAIDLVSALCYGCGSTTPAKGTETVYLLSQRTLYDTDGNITGSEKFTYDDSGRKLSLTIVNEDETKNITYEYEFFDEGTLKKETALYEDNSIYSELEYDEDGNEIYNYSSSLGIENKYTFENGRKKTGSKTSFFDADKQTVRFTYNYVYNEFGNIIQEESIYYDDSGSEIYSNFLEYTYEYNNDNLPVKKSSDYTDTVVTYDYDSRGNQILELSEVYDTDGRIIDSWKGTNTYDEHNNLTNEMGLNADDTIGYYIDYENTYDNAANIIECITTDENGNMISHYKAEYISIELPKTE